MATDRAFQIVPGRGDVLVVVDVQKDFLPGGALAVPSGDEVVPALNRYLSLFASRGLPVVATRDWHPPNHCSFRQHGGLWPPHCVVDSWGAAFADELLLPPDVVVVSKATHPSAEAYSDFEGTDLAQRLRAAGMGRLFVGGLATEYCVRATVNDALKLRFAVVLLTDAIRALDAQPGDGRRAEEEIVRLGAVPATWQDIA
jgi:nicotinamidase/pyrazinamidase